MRPSERISQIAFERYAITEQAGEYEIRTLMRDAGALAIRDYLDEQHEVEHAKSAVARRFVIKAASKRVGHGVEWGDGGTDGCFESQDPDDPGGACFGEPSMAETIHWLGEMFAMNHLPLPVVIEWLDPEQSR